MKTITTGLVTTFCAFISCTLNSQNDCNTTLSLFAENVKTKNYAEAAPRLIFLRKNCATLNYAIYAYGEKVLKDKLKQAKEKKPVALELIQLYTDRIKLFPKKTKKGIFLPKIGATMIHYKIGTPEEQYNVFDEAFKNDTAHFTHPRYLYQYFELYYNRYTSGKYGISLEDLIEKYEVVKNTFTSEKEKLTKTKGTSATKNSSAIDAYIKNMEALIEKEATCETLIPMYTKKFESNKGNLQWMRKAAGKLNAKECENDLLFIQLVEAIDALEPTANSKLYLYQICKRKGNSAKAEEYLRQYCTLETNGIKKAQILNKLGNEATKIGQKSKAHTYYVEALKANPSSGRIYLNLAKLYGSSANECGTDEFSKKAVYWKAAEMARKASKVDTSVKKEANEWIERYMKLAPNKTAIFNKTYKGGEKIALKCWIGGNVIVPKL